VPRRSDENDGPIRAFFAVDLGAAARAAAAELQQVLRRGPGGDGVRWVLAEGLHVTLRFLGDVEPARLSRLVDAVRSEVSTRSPFELHLCGLAGLPGSRHPRVVVLEVAPAEPLEGLAAAVERGAVAAGFEPETRPFRAHLTLGRVRVRYALPPEGRRPAPAPSPFAVEEAVLYRSRLGPGGSRYTPLERLALGGANHP
jgi:2'-5' RNA ligase